MPPIYDYKCPRCGQVQEAIRCIAHRHNGPACPGHPTAVPMELVISPVRGNVVNPSVPRRVK